MRGRSRSAPAGRVVEQVRGLAARYREIVLSGINLGRWGREPGSTMRLADLIRRLLAETGVERLRLSSVEPMDFSDDLLGLMAESSRIAKHVHAPLQTGSDRILRHMHRKYRPRHYADRILKARALMPDAAIGADVMVGFPGETEADFEENRRFIADLPFTYLHVFTYSERPGTPAAEDPDAVPMAVRKERNRALRELAAAKNRAFRESMVGKTLSAVTLHEAGDGAHRKLPEGGTGPGARAEPDCGFGDRWSGGWRVERGHISACPKQDAEPRRPTGAPYCSLRPPLHRRPARLNAPESGPDPPGLVPLAAGSIWTFGLMRLAGIELNLANSIFLPLILGAGVEYGIIIVLRWREGNGGSPGTGCPIEYRLGCCPGRALHDSGLRSLTISEHHGVHSLGLLTTIGSLSVLGAAVLFLPALIRLVPDRLSWGKTKEVKTPRPASGHRRKRR